MKREGVQDCHKLAQMKDGPFFKYPITPNKGEGYRSMWNANGECNVEYGGRNGRVAAEANTAHGS